MNHSTNLSALKPIIISIINIIIIIIIIVVVVIILSFLYGKVEPIGVIKGGCIKSSQGSLNNY